MHHRLLRGKVGPLRRRQQQLQMQLRSIDELTRTCLFQLGQFSIHRPELFQELLDALSDARCIGNDIADLVAELLALYEENIGADQQLAEARQAERSAELKRIQSERAQQKTELAASALSAALERTSGNDPLRITNECLWGHWVYVIRDADKQVLYVGQSNNVLDRLSTHRNNWMPNDAHADLIQAASRDDALEIERTLIRELRPVRNLMHNQHTTEGNPT
jgi:predicted GIY-YIG superfamily endonuclease